MTAPNTPSQQTTPAPSSTPSGGTPTNAPVSPPSPPEVWRAGPDAPEWARGKTGAEITAITQGLMDSLSRPSLPQPTPAASPAGQLPLDPQGYATGQDVTNAVAAAAQQFQPALERLAQQNAASTYRLVATDPRFSDVFAKYGPEVGQYLGNVPKA